ncbi:hypothetical protein PT974_12459 [Cladobotryum mycophilum]|uniref:Uncharacterized protein n=1 Tax=Cladobotryum mycophilum TaxID=491253 RepID=A0ABR0S959_9HYPO
MGLLKSMRHLFSRLGAQDQSQDLNGNLPLLKNQHALSKKYGPLGKTLDDGFLGNVAADATHEQRLKHLTLLVRDYPDRWACHKCMAIHQVNKTDTPTHPQSVNCPFGWQGLQDSSYRCHSFALHHRHLQLALKYTRLKEPRYDRYLASLLMPYHEPLYPKPYAHITIEGIFSVYPKIVGGKYLLLLQWDYGRDYQDVSRPAMGSLAICSHQVFDGTTPFPPWSRFYRGNLNRLVTDHPAYMHNQLANAIDSALLSQNVGLEGYCSFCPTEFFVKASPNHVTIRAWKDLGGEGSVSDPTWSIQAQDSPAKKKPSTLGIVAFDGGTNAPQLISHLKFISPPKFILPPEQLREIPFLLNAATTRRTYLIRSLWN